MRESPGLGVVPQLYKFWRPKQILKGRHTQTHTPKGNWCQYTVCFQEMLLSKMLSFDDNIPFDNNGNLKGQVFLVPFSNQEFFC